MEEEECSLLPDCLLFAEDKLETESEDKVLFDEDEDTGKEFAESSFPVFLVVVVVVVLTRSMLKELVDDGRVR